jgi:uncharacterized protein YeaO (DUF488 family)
MRLASAGGMQLDVILERAKHSRVTLLYAARDPKINHAVVLKEVMEKRRRHAKN